MFLRVSFGKRVGFSSVGVPGLSPVLLPGVASAYACLRGTLEGHVS